MTLTKVLLGLAALALSAGIGYGIKGYQASTISKGDCVMVDAFAVLGAAGTMFVLGKVSYVDDKTYGICALNQCYPFPKATVEELGYKVECR